MPTPAYMLIEGERQGLISSGAFTSESVGNIYQEGFEDNILVQSINHSMKVPTGQRIHGPFMISKVLDKSSPLLATAMTTGERLTKCQIRWYRTSAQGIQEHYYSTNLVDAIIVDISTTMPHAQDPAMAHFTHLETVAFQYRAIVWNHESCGTSGGDDWRKPVST